MRTSPSDEAEEGPELVHAADVNGDGVTDQLLRSSDCGTAGCMFSLRVSAGTGWKVPFGIRAKDCSILETRTAGYSDVECIHRYWVERSGPSWVRATNTFHWTGSAYVSPLDHLAETHPERPARPAPCALVRAIEPTEVLLLPARGIRISQQRQGEPQGWEIGPPDTPVIGRLSPENPVPALEEAVSAETGAWLLLRIAEHSTGWVPANSVKCQGG